MEKMRPSGFRLSKNSGSKELLTLCWIAEDVDGFVGRGKVIFREGLFWLGLLRAHIARVRFHHLRE